MSLHRYATLYSLRYSLHFFLSHLEELLLLLQPCWPVNWLNKRFYVRLLINISGTAKCKKKALWEVSSPMLGFCCLLPCSENCISVLIFPKAIHCNPDCLGILQRVTTKEKINTIFFSTFDCMSYSMHSTYLPIAHKRCGDAWPGQILLKFMEGFLPTSIDLQQSLCKSLWLLSCFAAQRRSVQGNSYNKTLFVLK